MKKRTKKTKEKKLSLSDFSKQMEKPVKPELFAFAVPLYQAAASGELHGAHIPKPDPEKPGMYLTNIPINRGMLAVMNQTRHLSHAERGALTWRLMHFGQAIQAALADERFGEHVKPGDEPESLLISSEFQDAYAVCKFETIGENSRPDMEDLLARLPKEPTP
jgi:hypothetical protein